MLVQWGSASAKRLVERLEPGTYFLLVDGRLCESSPQHGTLVDVVVRTCGGKGGFGALLRSFKVFKCPNQNMCRDLTGRRLKEVEEEKRIKEWMAKRAEREAEKERRRQEKLEKLRKGVLKHEFNDREFSTQSEEILEKTDEALDAAMRVQVCSDGQTTPESDDGSDDSIDADVAGTSAIFKRKRKRHQVLPSQEPTLGSEPVMSRGQLHMQTQWRQDKATFTSGEESNDEEEPATKKVKEADKIEEAREPVADKKDEETSKAESALAEKTKKPPKQKEKSETMPPVQHDSIDLMSYENVEQLYELPMEHLKQELQRRGLKCGGSLQERAQRLWIVRGLKPKKWPKNILAKK